jgi:hypothetical protein
MVAETLRAHVESSESMIKDALKSVRGGARLRKQPRRMMEPGACISMCVCVSMHVCMYAWICTCMDVYMHAACVLVCLYVFM